MTTENESSNARVKPESYAARLKKLENVSAQTKGQIAFIGRLVVAVPDGLNWGRILNEDGEVIRYHYRDLSDEDLIKIIIYQENAKALFAIDSKWYASRMDAGKNQLDTSDYEKTKLMYERTEAALEVLKDFEYEELRQEFDSRRRNDFLRNGSRLDFEKTINRVALSYSGDLGETFERIDYSPIKAS